MRARLSLAAIFAAPAAACAMFVWISLRTLRNPYPLDYGEGVILDQVLRLAHGGNVYHASLASPPYLITNYPPLFLALQAPFARLFGAAYWYGRFISQVSAGAAALLVGGTLWHMTRDRIAAAAGGVLTLAAPILGFWAQTDRVDALALAFGWTGLFLLVRRRERPPIAAAAALIVAAGFTRQTSWLPPTAAAIAWLVAGGQRKDAARLGAYVAVSGALLALVLQLATGGFLIHVLLAHGDPWRWPHFREGVVYIARQIAPMLLLAVVVGGARLLRGGREAAFAVAYVVFAAANAVMVGKAGAFWNYFIELTTACAFLCGLAVWRGGTSSGTSKEVPYRTTVVYVVALLLVALQGIQTLRVDRLFTPPLGRNYADVLGEMRRTPGVVVSDYRIGLVPLSGHRVYIEPFKLGIMAETGRWDEAPFLRDIEEHRVQLAVVHVDGDGRFASAQFTPRMQQAIVHALQRCRSLPADDGGADLIYRPQCMRYN